MPEENPLWRSVAQDAYRLAQMDALAAMPMAETDRLGRYLCLDAGMHPEAACRLYLFNAKKCLLSSHTLFSGRRRTLEYYWNSLRALARTPKSRYIAVSLCTADAAYLEEDFWEANRIALICQSKKIPVLEIMHLHSGSYYPVFRRADMDPIAETKKR